MTQVLQVEQPSRIGELVGFIHDEPFELARLEHDVDARTLRLPFGREDLAALHFRWHHMILSRWSLPLFEHVLEVRDVRSYVVDDKAQIGSYTLNTVEYDKPRDCVTIVACEDLVVRVDVEQLRLIVTATGRTIGTRSLRVILGCEVIRDKMFQEISP